MKTPVQGTALVPSLRVLQAIHAHPTNTYQEPTWSFPQLAGKTESNKAKSLPSGSAQDGREGQQPPLRGDHRDAHAVSEVCEQTCQDTKDEGVPGEGEVGVRESFMEEVITDEFAGSVGVGLAKGEECDTVRAGGAPCGQVWGGNSESMQRAAGEVQETE